MPNKDKAKHAENTKRYRQNNPQYYEKMRKARRTKDGCIDATGETKGGPCEICGQVYKQLDYDHDHKTGKHRGWLCRWCNMKLGWFDKWEAKIMSYLGRSQ